MAGLPLTPPALLCMRWCHPTSLRSQKGFRLTRSSSSSVRALPTMWLRRLYDSCSIAANSATTCWRERGGHRDGLDDDRGENGEKGV
jgi:hypothetical protein